MQVDLKSSKGEVIKKISASDDIWKQPFNDVLVHQVVVMPPLYGGSGWTMYFSVFLLLQFEQHLNPQKSSG